jgi:type II secretory pathway component PulM
MPRAPRSEVGQLLQEVRGLEVLASEAEIEPNRLQDYWQLSTDLVALAMEVESLDAGPADGEVGDERLLALRHRARDIGARLAEMVAD